MLSIAYNFSFITPNTTGNFQLTVPITVLANLTAIGNSGQNLWKVNIHGRGTAVLGGFYDSLRLHLEGVDFTYKGKTSVVPEPGTWLMLGTGALAIILWRMKATAKVRGI